MRSEEDADEFHTVRASHPEHGDYELSFRVLAEDNLTLRPDQSSFPVDGQEERMQCVEHASDILTEERGDDLSVGVNADEL